MFLTKNGTVLPEAGQIWIIPNYKNMLSCAVYILGPRPNLGFSGQKLFNVINLETGNVGIVGGDRWANPEFSYRVSERVV